MSYDDAFTIEKVIRSSVSIMLCYILVQIDEELIKKFTYVAGIVPVLKAYIKEVETVDLHNYYDLCAYVCCIYIAEFQS